MHVRELIDILSDQPPDAEVELAVIAPVDEDSDDITVDRYPVDGVLPWNDDESEGLVIWLIGGEDDDVDAFLDAVEQESARTLTGPVASVRDARGTSRASGVPATGRRPAAGGYLPALDGLRAISVVAVLLYHADMLWLPGGFLGVEVFFVISGYLITMLLVRRSHDRTSTISLQALLDAPRPPAARRRCTRCWPSCRSSCWCSTARTPSKLAGQVWAALTYVTNWYLIFSDQSYFAAVERPPVFQHLWSLAIEEQFYLVWPLLLLGLLRAVPGPRPADRRPSSRPAPIASLVWMAVLFEPAVDPSRVVLRHRHPGVGPAARRRPGPAVEARTPSVARRRRGQDASPSTSPAWPARRHHRAASPSCEETDSFLYRGGFAVLSRRHVRGDRRAVHPGTVLGRAVRSAGRSSWVGKRSYSLYLWHWPIFVYTRPEIDLPLALYPTLVLRLGLTVVAAELSYRFVEVPIRNGAFAPLAPAPAPARGARAPRRPDRPRSVGRPAPRRRQHRRRIRLDRPRRARPARAGAAGRDAGTASTTPPTTADPGAAARRIGRRRPRTPPRRRRRRRRRRPRAPPARTVTVLGDSVLIGAQETLTAELEASGYIVDYRATAGVDARRRRRRHHRRRQPGRRDRRSSGLGHNSLWETDRANFDNWAGKFDREADALSPRSSGSAPRRSSGSRCASRRSASSRPRARSSTALYVWYFPYVNERLACCPAPPRRRARRLGGGVQPGRPDVRRDAPHELGHPADDRHDPHRRRHLTSGRERCGGRHGHRRPRRGRRRVDVRAHPRRHRQPGASCTGRAAAAAPTSPSPSPPPARTSGFIGRRRRRPRSARRSSRRARAAPASTSRLQRGGRTGCVVVLVDRRRRAHDVPGPRRRRRARADRRLPTSPAPPSLHLPLYGFLDPSPPATCGDAAARGARGGRRASTIDLSASSAVEQLGVAACHAARRDAAPGGRVRQRRRGRGRRPGVDRSARRRLLRRQGRAAPGDDRARRRPARRSSPPSADRRRPRHDRRRRRVRRRVHRPLGRRRDRRRGVRRRPPGRRRDARHRRARRPPHRTEEDARDAPQPVRRRRGRRRAGRRRRRRGDGVDDLLQPRPAGAGQRRGARSAARRRSATPAPCRPWSPCSAAAGRSASPATTSSGSWRPTARSPSATSPSSPRRAPTASRRCRRRSPSAHLAGIARVRDRRHRRRPPRERAQRRRLRRPRRDRPPPGRHDVRRRQGVPRPARRRSSCSTRSACRCSAGATTGSRRSTPAPAGSPSSTASSRPPRSRRSVRHRPDPSTGVLLTAPIPADAELDATAARRRRSPPPSTPAPPPASAAPRSRRSSSSTSRRRPAARSVRANLALAEHNASVAAQVAVSGPLARP